jgi:hypothetical protein
MGGFYSGKYNSAGRQVFVFILFQGVAGGNASFTKN